MSTPPTHFVPVPHRLRTARVLRVEEQACEVWDGATSRVGFASVFPSPRVERVHPGHLVAIASSPNGIAVVVWRWYDAVVLGAEDDGLVEMWEPAHGVVTARVRPSYEQQIPGSRAYASAGLPGADWWVVANAGGPDPADVELDEVDLLYTENGLWSVVFQDGAGGTLC